MPEHLPNDEDMTGGDAHAPREDESPEAGPSRPAAANDVVPPARRPEPGAGNGHGDGDTNDTDDDDEPVSLEDERVFEADPSLSLPGVRDVHRPGYRDAEWANTEPDEHDRFEPIPGLVDVPGEPGADAETASPARTASRGANTPPAALEAGAGPAGFGEATDADEEAPVPQSPEQIAHAMESLLFVSNQPLNAQRLRELLGLTSVVPIRQAAAKLRDEYDRRGRSFELVERAGGYLLQTRPEYAPYVNKLQRQRQETRISPAALTTLSIIAYRQPLTRTEVDAIRGVGSSHHIRALLERGLIKVVGRKNVPGYPSLYGTTSRFLLQFGLRSLRDLPQEADFDEVDEQALRAQPAEADEGSGDVDAAAEEHAADSAGDPHAGDESASDAGTSDDDGDSTYDDVEDEDEGDFDHSDDEDEFDEDGSDSDDAR